jgi:hypothetical protein
MAQIFVCYDPHNKIVGANAEARERWDLSEVKFAIPDKMRQDQLDNIALHLVRLLLTAATAVEDAGPRPPYYPPVPQEELENCHAYEHCFDRVVVTTKGVYARHYDGKWLELRAGSAATPRSKEWPFPPEGRPFNTTENKMPVFKPGDRVETEAGAIKLVEDYRSDPEPSIKFVGAHVWFPLSQFKFTLVDQG